MVRTSVDSHTHCGEPTQTLRYVSRPRGRPHGRGRHLTLIASVILRRAERKSRSYLFPLPDNTVFSLSPLTPVSPDLSLSFPPLLFIVDTSGVGGGGGGLYSDTVGGH